MKLCQKVWSPHNDINMTKLGSLWATLSNGGRMTAWSICDSTFATFHGDDRSFISGFRAPTLVHCRSAAQSSPEMVSKSTKLLRLWWLCKFENGNKEQHEPLIANDCPFQHVIRLLHTCFNKITSPDLSLWHSQANQGTRHSWNNPWRNLTKPVWPWLWMKTFPKLCSCRCKGYCVIFNC